MENAEVSRENWDEMRSLKAEAENLAIEMNNLQERGGLGSEKTFDDGSEQAIKLGNKILTYNPEQVRREANEIRENTERIQGIVNTENGIERETKINPSTVGLESRTLFDEYQAQDEENLRNEINPNRDHEAKIAARDQGNVVEGVMSNVDAIMNQANPRVLDLVNLWSNGGNQILKDAENPRRLGDRN